MSRFHAHDDGEHDLLGHGPDAATHDDHPPAGARHEPHGPASLLDRLDPRGRILAAAGFALAVVLVDTIAAAGTALVLALLTAGCARLRVLPTLRRLAALDGFVLLAVALLPFSLPGTPVFTLAGYPASAEGFLQAGLILVKANAVVLALLALVGSLESVTFGAALGRLGVPDRLVLLYLLTVRYLDVIHREYARLRLAMRARAFTLRTDRHSWVTIGYLFGMLIVRSLDRAERVHAAMRCRGFDGRFPCLAPPTVFRPVDGAFAVGTAVVALALVAIGRGA